MWDWKFYRDSENNSFYVDGAWNIVVTDKQKFNYKTVSLYNIDFSYHSALELLRDKDIPGALSILKSIMLMSEKNNIVTEYKVKASKLIKRLRVLNGSRYSIYNRKASILNWSNKKNYNIVNDFMRYRLFFEKKTKVLSNRSRFKNKYNYNGLKIGVRSNTENSSYLYITTVNSEKFSVKIKSVGRLEENWRNNLGKDIFERKKIEFSKNKKVYLFKTTIENKSIIGFESFVVNGKFGYMVRVLSSDRNFKKYKDEMLDVVEKFDFMR